MTVIPNVTGALGTNPKKRLEDLEIRGQIETVLTTVLLRSARILRKGNFKRETESLRIAAQNNAIKTNNIKARIDKTQQNSKCRLCSDRDKTINHIISEYTKWAQREYKTRHDWVGQVMHWEICKEFKFDHVNKWYMYNLAPVLENDTHKLLWDFDIQTDHQISARRPHFIIIKKKKRIC